jgi:hypothetical protein
MRSHPASVILRALAGYGGSAQRRREAASFGSKLSEATTWTGSIQREAMRCGSNLLRRLTQPPGAGTRKRDSPGPGCMIQDLRKERSLGSWKFLDDERPVRPAQTTSVAGYSGQRDAPEAAAPPKSMC